MASKLQIFRKYSYCLLLFMMGSFLPLRAQVSQAITAAKWSDGTYKQWWYSLSAGRFKPLSKVKLNFIKKDGKVVAIKFNTGRKDEDVYARDKGEEISFTRYFKLDDYRNRHLFFMRKKVIIFEFTDDGEPVFWGSLKGKYSEKDKQTVKDFLAKTKQIQQAEIRNNQRNKRKHSQALRKKAEVFPRSRKKHPNMVQVKRGTFPMGVTQDHTRSDNQNARPVHTVAVNSFYISKYEITAQQYADFLNEYKPKIPQYGKYKGIPIVSHGWHKGQPMLSIFTLNIHYKNGTWAPRKLAAKHPVVDITWYGAYAYCKFYGGKLPSEAEWEYAARGGNKTKGWLTWKNMKANANLEAYGWTERYTRGYNKLRDVGRLKPNELGLYDTMGNAGEWCNDWYDNAYYKSSPKSNPKGPRKGSYRVWRGGSYLSLARKALYDFRHYQSPESSNRYIGFRIVVAR